MARARSSRRQRQQAAEAAPDEDIEVEVAADEEADSSGGSGRRSSRRSARGSARGSARSSRKSRRKSKKSKKSKAEGEGGGSTGKIIIAIVALLVLGGGGYFAYDQFIKEEPTSRTLELLGKEQTFVGTKSGLAHQFWDETRAQRNKVEKALEYKNEDEAQKHLEALTLVVRQPELGGGNTKPNPEDPTIGDIELARKAAEVLPKLERYQAKITQIRNDKAAAANHKQLKLRVTRIVELSDEELDRVQEDIERFTQNPASPDAGPDLAHQQTYKRMINDLESRLYEVSVERLRRVMENTTDVVEAINRETQKLIQQDRYQQALRMVDEAMTAYPDAKLEPVREKVVTSAEESWSGTKTLIDAKIQAAKSQGNTGELREAARLEVISKLERVISRYGSEAPETRDFVRKAEQMLKEFRGD